MASAKFSLPLGVDRSQKWTEQIYGVLGRKVILKLNSPAAWGEGSGAFRYGILLDFGSDNRIFIRRHVTASSATPTSDLLECGILAGALGDTDPRNFNNSALLTPNPLCLALAVASDGKSISFQEGPDETSLKEVVSRLTTFDVSGACMVVVNLIRDVSGSTIVPSTMDVARVFADTSTAPSPGGAVTKTGAIMHFAGSTSLHFPSQPTARGFLAGLRLSNGTSLRAVVAQTATGTTTGGQREMRITPSTDPNPLQLQYYDGTLATPAALGGGAVPVGSYCVIHAAQDPTTRQITTRLWNPALTNPFVHSENVGTLAAGATISDVNARITLGAAAITTALRAIAADISWAAATTGPVTSTQFEGLITSGVATREAVRALPNILWAADRIDPATGTEATLWTSFVGGNEENTRLGTLTIVTDTGNVPYNVGTAGGTPPTPVVSVPTPKNFSAVSGGVNPADPTKGLVNLAVDLPANTANFTKHATHTEFLSSTDNVTFTGLGWQSATTLQVTNAPLDTGVPDPEQPEGSTATRAYSVHHRDASGVVGDQADAILVTVQSGTVVTPLTEVDDLHVVWTAPGTFQVDFLAPPTAEDVDAYGLWVSSANVAINYDAPPAWTGTGTVSGGRVTLPAQSGYDLNTKFRIGVKPIDTDV